MIHILLKRLTDKQGILFRVLLNIIVDASFWSSRGVFQRIFLIRTTLRRANIFQTKKDLQDL